MLANRSPKTSGPRAGFTLIELLVVIALIGILAGLLVPAVGSVMRRVRITSVRTEISQLESAIARFRANYNMDPPSSITLYEAVAGWDGDANSKALVRQMWPQFNFANPSLDINGDGDFTDTITLSQGECLVFFLGGMGGNAAGSASADNNIPLQIGACTGFSKNPANPFARGGNREAPLFEFLPARFTDLAETPPSPNPTGIPSFPNGDGFPEYRDPLPNQTMPYLYYSGYDGTGYVTGEFVGGGLTQPYRTAKAATAPAWKANSYQIISPGYDKEYGSGGPYVATGNDHLATSPPTDRHLESDNITNFSPAELQP